MNSFDLRNGDCLEVLKTIEDNSIDSIVTDPPYGLSFMNKHWDYDVPGKDVWIECLRVLKPGGHLLSFGGSRTYHRMAVAIEDAGFEIRDQIMWVYGSGFPKSLNIGKAIDKRSGESIAWFGEWLKKWREENNIPQSKIAELFPSKTGGLTGCVSNWELGNNLPTNEQFNLICETFRLPFKSLEEAKRQYIGTKTSGIGKAFTKDGWGSGHDEVEITKGNSEWEGWGTSLKPAHEPIVVARKPLSEKSVAENVLKWRTGAINIDGSRIPNSGGTKKTATENCYESNGIYGNGLNGGVVESLENEGRFPANIIFECTCDEVITGEKGEVKITNRIRKQSFTGNKVDRIGLDNYNDKADIHTNPNCPMYILDEQSGKGGASRFFYCSKVSKKERNEGLDEFEDSKLSMFALDGIKKLGRATLPGNEHQSLNVLPNNTHPTVKPISLMSYLIKLVTPVGGTTLDPFMGSGSTGKAAIKEGFKFVGIEREKDYFEIAKARIEYELDRKTN